MHRCPDLFLAHPEATHPPPWTLASPGRNRLETLASPRTNIFPGMNALALVLLACAVSIAGPAPSPTLRKSPHPRYVFLFIGDGMGLAQTALAEAYRASSLGDTLGFSATAWSGFPSLGMATTQCANRRITESSAAATAFATGSKTLDGTLSLDPHDASPMRTLAEEARDQGRSVGILTTTSIDHATPAAFYSHVPDRNRYHEIGIALARSRMQVFAGGSFRDPEGIHAAHRGSSVWSLVEKAGYEVVRGRSALKARTKPDVLAFAAPAARDSALPWQLDRPPTSDDQPDLTDFVRETSRILESNPKGFFVMAEGGKIDWACHRNDPRAAIEEVWGLDSAVRAALDFAQRHPGEVLIVVTADHETGGLSLGNGSLGYRSNFGLLRFQRASQETLEDSLARVAHGTEEGRAWKRSLDGVGRWFGLGSHPSLPLSRPDTLRLREAFLAERSGKPGPWGSYGPLAWTATRLLSEKAGVGWTTGAHTAIPVPVHAWGEGAELFQGRMDNTGIADRLRRILDAPRP